MGTRSGGIKMIAAVQAGGRSRRMGRDKALIELRGKPLIEYVLAAAKPVADRLLIVTNESTATPEAYQRLAARWGADLRFDIQSGCGPLGGIETSLLACEPDESALVLACDLPFLSAEFLGILQRRHQESGAVITVPLSRDLRVQPLVAIYTPRCLPAVKTRIERGLLRVDLLFDEVPTCRVQYQEYRHVTGSERLFVNLNTAVDLQLASADNPA
ncbi:MAG: molybdenum cofactor guanylyltransferase [Acidobacteriota bacterium]